MSGPGWNAAVEATFRIHPRPRAFISPRRSLVRWTTATMLTRIILISVSSTVSANGPYTPKPALFTSASTRTPCSRSEEHTSELQSQFHLVCRLLLEKKKKTTNYHIFIKKKKKKKKKQ